MGSTASASAIQDPVPTERGRRQSPKIGGGKKPCAKGGSVNYSPFSRRNGSILVRTLTQFRA